MSKGDPLKIGFLTSFPPFQDIFSIFEVKNRKDLYECPTELKTTQFLTFTGNLPQDIYAKTPITPISIRK